MKRVIFACFVLAVVQTGFGEHRFGRPVIKVADAKSYQFTKSDDIEYPMLSNERFVVTCVVYRGRENYYAEVTITNKTDQAVYLSPSLISFDKPGYTVNRIDTMIAAREAAAAAGMIFTPTPAPYVAPTYTTTGTATATTYGNQTNISSTSTTTADTSGQAGANFGNALGNAIAAHRFYKFQQTQDAFSHFLAAHTQRDMDGPLPPGQSRTIVATFDQSVPKKRPFVVTVTEGSDSFRFIYKE